MTCATCGTLLPARARFCLGCGGRVALQQRVAVAAAPPRLPGHPIARDDLRAAMAARHELGERMESDVVDAFLDRVSAAIDERVDARLAARLHGPRPHGTDGGGVALAICSVIFGIPLTGIAAIAAGLPGMIGVWTTIVLVNASYNQRRRD